MLKYTWMLLACWALFGLCLRVIGQTTPADTDAAPSTPENATSEPVVASSPRSDRLREGTKLIDEPGHFDESVERPVFVDASGNRFTGLENLNLQRIARTLGESEQPTLLEWTVSGLVTEYEGINYILIERAVYRRPSQKNPL